MARGTYGRPWAGLVVSLLACAVVGTASGASGLPADAPAPVTATGLRVLQMNLCDSGAALCYSGRSVAQAGALIRLEAPDVVTLNEVCRDDVATLRTTMTGGGGVVVTAFQAAWDRRTGDALRCLNGQAYGIGLVARLPGLARGYDTLGGAYPDQDPGAVEERAWLCLSPTAGAAATTVAVCTTHLANSDAAAARAQCAYLLDTAIPAVRAHAAAPPVVLGGDLNLRSGGSPDALSCVPAGHRHADDGLVQHVVTTAELTIGAPRTIEMTATDHPGLLVTLTRTPLLDDAPDVRAAG